MTTLFDTDKDALAYITKALEEALMQALAPALLVNNEANRKMLEDVIARQVTVLWDMNHYSKQFRDNLRFEVVQTSDPYICAVQWLPITLLGCDMLEAMCPELKDQIDVAREQLSKPVEITFTINVNEGVDVKTVLENGDCR